MNLVGTTPSKRERTSFVGSTGVLGYVRDRVVYMGTPKGRGRQRENLPPPFQELGFLKGLTQANESRNLRYVHAPAETIRKAMYRNGIRSERNRSEGEGRR